MFRHEGLAILFFAHLVMAALVRRRMPLVRRVSVVAGAVAATAAVVAIARAGGSAAREWAPIAYILAAYYLSGRTFFAPMPRVEAWLTAIDYRVFGDPVGFTRWPAGAMRLLDAAYIGCFLLVPGGLILLKAGGHGERWDEYWTLVAGAELGAFATLPYLQTRPPWVLERLAERRDGGGLSPSVVYMQVATTGANTLPSGHAAGSFAVAFAVMGAMPPEGLLLLALAITIGAAAVVTRAHFVVDVVTGVALAGAVWWLAGAGGT
jgi:membrane-associated phospholipid phosphatase